MTRLSNTEREKQIMLIWPLYRFWRCSGMEKRRFIRKNKAEVDRIILTEINKEPQS